MTNNLKEIDRLSKDLYQVYAILNFIPDVQKNKIPNEIYDYILKNMQFDNEFYLDSEVEIMQQNLSPMAKAIFVELYSKYISDNPEKWAKYNRICDNFEEEEKREKYNPDNIFKEQNNITESMTNNENHAETSLIEYKESFFTKFKKFIFKILHIT